MSALPSLELLLRANPYPGRGLLVARTDDGRRCAGFVITGRSEASQARCLRHDADGDVRVAPTGDARPDPLRHYVALARRGAWLAVGNGNQVPDVAADLDAGADLLTALSRHGYDRDEPYWTSRITVAARPGQTGPLVVGASRRPLRGTEASDTTVLALADLGAPGSAVLVTTYQSDGEHVTPAAGYREVRSDAAGPQELADAVWSAVNPRYRVAVLVVDLDDPATVLLRNR